MSLRQKLFVGCCAAMSLAPLARANGGVIILLHPEYHYHLGDGPCRTLVFVASDQQVAHLDEQLETEADIAAVKVADTRLRLKLVPVDDQHLTGTLLNLDRPVMVVSDTYAAAHHLEPAVDHCSSPLPPSTIE